MPLYASKWSLCFMIYDLRTNLKYDCVSGRIILTPRQQFPRSILVASSWHPRWRARHGATSSRGCYEDVARDGWLPRSASHALTWLVGRRSAAVYIVLHARLSVCRVVHEPDAHGMLRTSSRGCHENATRTLRRNCFRGI